MGRPPLRLGRPKGRPQAPFQPSHENRYPFTNWSTFAPPKWSKFTPPLTFVRLLNRFPKQEPFEVLDELLLFTSVQLGVDSTLIEEYRRRRQTISEHQQRITRYRGLCHFGAEERRRLELEEHYTDTHGYTDINFAAFAMLGRRFSPRIRGLKKQRLYRVDTRDYGILGSLVGRADWKIDTRGIADQ